ncbi:MAG: restriction endonuclease subunit S [Pseudomonadota bacterium]
MIKLNQIAEIISGHPFRTKIADEQGGDTYVVQMKDLTTHGVDWREVAKTQIERVKESRYIKNGDILLVARGNRHTATLVDDVPGLSVCSPHFFLIRTQPYSDVEPGFLNWYLNQLPAQRYFERSAQGSDIRSVRREVLAAMEIPAVPVNQQRTISDLACTLYQHQAKLQALIENDQRIMDGIAQSLMSTH